MGIDFSGATDGDKSLTREQIMAIHQTVMEGIMDEKTTVLNSTKHHYLLQAAVALREAASATPK